MTFNTPILFLIFNRPELTKRVFEEIKKQKPKYLFIAADGPRPFIKGDIEKCEATRVVVLNGIDWDCEVKTLFRDENLGCGRAVSEAITWFFGNVEQGIILEDDCLPHFSFFGFCEVLLEKHKDDRQVYSIGGTDFLDGKQIGNASYYYSYYGSIWGWASWRSAWDTYDYNLKQLDTFKKKQLISKLDSRAIFRNYWYSIFDKTFRHEIDTWDYQWLFSIWNNEGIQILPNVNLISNIGFGKDATHTNDINNAFANVSTHDIGVLIHPKVIKVNKKADRYVSDKFIFSQKSSMKPISNLFRWFKEKVKNVLYAEVKYKK